MSKLYLLFEQRHVGRIVFEPGDPSGYLLSETDKRQYGDYEKERYDFESKKRISRGLKTRRIVVLYAISTCL